MSTRHRRAILGTAIAVIGCVVSGCRVANEYASSSEAVEVSRKWSREISAIAALERNHREIWLSEDKLEAWKRDALPVLEQAGVVTAQLMQRTANANRSKPFSKKVILTRVPPSKMTHGGGGWIPVPARYPVAGSVRGTVVASRGRCSLHGREHTLYAYDFFGDAGSNHWLRCVFWDPLPLVAE